MGSLEFYIHIALCNGCRNNSLQAFVNLHHEPFNVQRTSQETFTSCEPIILMSMSSIPIQHYAFYCMTRRLSLSRHTELLPYRKKFLFDEKVIKPSVMIISVLIILITFKTILIYLQSD